MGAGIWHDTLFIAAPAGHRVPGLFSPAGAGPEGPCSVASPPGCFWVRFCKRAEGLAGPWPCTPAWGAALATLPVAEGTEEPPSPCLGKEGGDPGTRARSGGCTSPVLQARPGDPLVRHVFAPQQWPHFEGGKGDALCKPPPAAASPVLPHSWHRHTVQMTAGLFICPSTPPARWRCGVQPQNLATLPPGVSNHLALG